MFDHSPLKRSIVERSVVFKAVDGAELVGRLYQPEGRAFAAVVLNSATGVPQDFYAHFARWLAEERGMACLTYDYRGFGRSHSGPLRRVKADMVDWGVTDQKAARALMRRMFPRTQMWVIGHSLGAMLLPNQTELEGVTRVIGIASGFVHHTCHPWPYRAVVLAFWFGIGPLATAVCGYLPGKALKFGEDLPAGVYWQWRKWCTSHDFYTADFGARLSPPDWTSRASVRLIAFSDDDLVPPSSVARLAEVYGPSAEQVVIDPKADGLEKVGHLGAFSRRNRALWPRILQA